MGQRDGGDGAVLIVAASDVVAFVALTTLSLFAPGVFPAALLFNVSYDGQDLPPCGVRFAVAALG